MRKTLWVAVLMGLLIYSLMGLPPNYAEHSAHDDMRVETTGTTYVDASEEWRNITKTLDGDLIINTTGNLTLYNVTLLMNCSFDGQYHIEVREGGRLYIYNSRLASANGTSHYTFYVQAGATFVMKASELTDCGYAQSSARYGKSAGLFIEASDTAIEGCELYDNHYGVIYSSSANNTIKDCAIYDNELYGISIVSSTNVSIENCNVSSNGGINISDSDNITITRCNITGSTASGLTLSICADIAIADCKVNENNVGIYLEDCTRCTVEGTELRENNVAIYLAASEHCALTGNTLTGNAEAISLNASENVTINDNALMGGETLTLELPETEVVDDVYYHSKYNNGSATDNKAYAEVKYDTRTLVVRNNGASDNWERWSFIKFNISALPPNVFINDVELILSSYDGQTNEYGDEAVKVYVVPEANDSWDEESSFDAGDPVPSARVIEGHIASFVVENDNTTDDHTHTLDVTSTVRDSYLTAGGEWTHSPPSPLISFKLVCDDDDVNDFAHIWSSEAGVDVRPKLVIHYVEYDGISVALSRKITLENNVVTNMNRGIYLYATTESSITNCEMTDGARGLELNASYDNEITNCELSRNLRTALHVAVGSDDNLFDGLQMNHNNGTAFFSASTANLVVNTSIEQSSDYDTRLERAATVECRNTDFDDAKLEFSDANSTLTRSWYLDVELLNLDGEHIAGANVVVKDNRSHWLGNFTTGAEGIARDIPCIAYTQNLTGKDYSMSNHSVHVADVTHSLNVSMNSATTLRVSYFSLGNIAFALSYVDMTITQENHLTIARGGFLRMSNVTLLVNFTIEPLCEIVVQNGGTLEINGSIVTSDALSAPYELRFLDASNGALADSTIERCGAVRLQSDNVTLHNCTFTGLAQGILCSGNAAPHIEQNTISNNSVGVHCSDSASPTFVNNTFANNRLADIYFASAWKVATASVINDVSALVMNGDLIVLANGSLRLSDVTLSLNCTVNGSFGLKVEANGALYVLDGTIIQSISNYSYLFVVDAAARMLMKDSELHNCGFEPGSDGSRAGLYLQSDDVTIDNCTLSDNWVGVYIRQASPSVLNSNISANVRAGIYCVNASTALLSGNTLMMNNGNGIYCEQSAPVITYNIISQNDNGIYCVAASPKIACNTLNDNNVGIMCENSTLELIENALTGNLVDIACALASELVMINCTIEDVPASARHFNLSGNSSTECINTTFNRTKLHFDDLNSTLSVAWYVNLNVLWLNDVPVKYGNVRIQDNANGSFDKNYSTGLYGKVSWVMLREYAARGTVNGTAIIDYLPYTRTASKNDEYGNTTLMNITQSMTIFIHLENYAPELLYVQPTDNITAIFETDELRFNVSATDPLDDTLTDDANLTYDWYFADALVQSGNLCWYVYQANSTSEGLYEVMVKVSDGVAYEYHIWQLTVKFLNEPPIISVAYPPVNVTILEWYNQTFELEVYDPDGNNTFIEWYTDNGAVFLGSGPEYIFRADGSDARDYYIMALVSDGGLITYHNWTVSVVNLRAIMSELDDMTLWSINITQVELLNVTDLITVVEGWITNLTTLKAEIDATDKEDVASNITHMIEQLQYLKANLTELKDTIEDLEGDVEQANSARDDAIANEQNAEDARSKAITDRRSAEKARDDAEAKLVYSVVAAIIAGLVLGILFALLFVRRHK